MGTDEVTRELDRKYPALLFMWGGMLFSLVLYGVVGGFLGGRIEPLAPDLEIILAPVLVVAAVMQGVISFLITWKMPTAPEGRLEWNLDRDEGTPPSERSGGDAGETVSRAWDGIHRRLLMSYALAESIGLYGLILYLLTGKVTYFGAFLAGAALALLRQYPSRERLRVALERKVENVLS